MTAARHVLQSPERTMSASQICKDVCIAEPQTDAECSCAGLMKSCCWIMAESIGLAASISSCLEQACCTLLLA